MKLVDSVVHQLHCSPKRTDMVRRSNGHLRSRRLQTVRVLILFLVVCEESLTGCSRVCVLAG